MLTQSDLSRAIILRYLLVLAVFGLTGIILFVIFFHTAFSNSLMTEREYHSKNLVTVATEVVDHLYQESIKTPSESKTHYQQQAIETLKSIAFEENGYYWISDKNGVMIMHPYKKDKVGEDLLNWQDKSGRYIFRDINDISKTGGGWLNYYWPKPNTDIPFEKISYVNQFKPWGWNIGTGIYLDDIKPEILRIVLQATGLITLFFFMFITALYFVANHLIKKLDNLAIKDDLTGLFSKRFLNEVAKIIEQRAQRASDRKLAVFFLDIDHFKHINDSFGHVQGDSVIKHVAHTISETCRQDALQIRYGGEEFLVIDFFSNEGLVSLTAERIRKAIASLKHPFPDCPPITISIGVTLYKESETLKDTIQRADDMLYQAKENGRNCSVFEGIVVSNAEKN